MKVAALVAILSASASSVHAAQTSRSSGPRQAAPPAVQTPDRMAQAYEQFLRARALRENDVAAAIAAYRRAMALDPMSADIPADLADLFMSESRWTDAIAAGEQALKLEPANREAHRVLGLVYAQLVGAEDQRGRATQQENLDKAVLHLEKAIRTPATYGDFTPRALLARLYVAGRQYDKAIAMLPDLVKQGWQEGASLLIEAYSAAGRSADAVKWLEDAAPDNPSLYSQLGEFYGRERRWADSATAYEAALKDSPRSVDLRIWMASSLLQTGSLADVVKARDALREAVTLRAADERALYLLSQAERRSGNPTAAESVARRLIAQNGKNPRGYVALAEALEEQHQFQALVDALAPVVATFTGSSDGGFASGMLLQHLGFAHQELGQYDRAVWSFESARKLSPNDPSITLYLMQAHAAAKNYSQVLELSKTMRGQRPGDLRFARLESLALRRSGKVTEGLSVLEEVARTQTRSPDAVVALAEGYLDANRAAQATKLLQDAQSRFPDDAGIVLQLGAALDKQKRFAESEAVLRQLIAKEPENALALNYLGYMLAERGERLNESVDLLKRALTIDPENGSYLDSIGWAYYKDGKLDLAFENMKRAADRLLTNSVVQDHYGDVLFKLGRYSEAIGAWDRALAGDGDSIERGDIDKKIRSARQKLPRR